MKIVLSIIFLVSLVALPLQATKISVTNETNEQITFSWTSWLARIPGFCGKNSNFIHREN